MENTKQFQEYPALTATVKDGQGTFHTLRAWSPRLDDPTREAGGLRASLSIQNPETGVKERHAVDLKPREHEGRKYLSGTIDRGEGQKPLLVRVVGVEAQGQSGRIAAVRLSEYGKDADGKTAFEPIKGQGGKLRMNAPLAELAKVKDTYEVAVMEERLGVKKEALEPKTPAHDQEQGKEGPANEQEAARESEPAQPQPEVEEEESLGMER